VITDDMLHTVLRRRAAGESVESIRPDLVIPRGRRKGQNRSLASIYRALAEHAKAEAYPEAVAQAHSDFAALQHSGDTPHRANTDTTQRKLTSQSGVGYRITTAQRHIRPQFLRGYGPPWSPGARPQDPVTVLLPTSWMSTP
jgi:hypothetical protein